MLVFGRYKGGSKILSGLVFGAGAGAGSSFSTQIQLMKLSWAGLWPHTRSHQKPHNSTNLPVKDRSPSLLSGYYSCYHNVAGACQSQRTEAGVAAPATLSVTIPLVITWRGSRPVLATPSWAGASHSKYHENIQGRCRLVPPDL